MFTRRPARPAVSAERELAESRIAVALQGGNSLPAWNAIWDLVQSSDSQGKQHVLEALRGYVATAAVDDSVAQAEAFGNTIEHSLRAPAMREAVLPSPEVRKQHRRDQANAHRQAMEDIGVRPGEGLPMWVMYMTRRSKRSWQ